MTATPTTRKPSPPPHADDSGTSRGVTADSAAGGALFEQALHRWPADGDGRHGYTFKLAKLALEAGLPPDKAVERIAASQPSDGRDYEKEIRDSVKSAYTLPPSEPPAPPAVDARAFWDYIMEQAHGMTENDLEAEIWERSPIRLTDDPRGDAVLLLDSLYGPDEFVFCGLEHDARPCLVQDHLKQFRDGDVIPPHIIPNPLTGQLAPKKGGDGMTYRGDNNVARFMVAVAEMDKTPRRDQLAFWYAVDLPVLALIDSGGKSIHAWVATAGVTTAAQWTRDVERDLFDRWLIPLGCDKACKNESRLSRLPGHYREDTAKRSRLLYLAANGKAVLQ